MENLRKIQKYHFSFKATTLDEIVNELKRLGISKASHVSNTSPNILKENTTLFFPFLLNFVKMPISSTTFPSVLKLADVTPVHKRDSHYQESNYQPVSVPPNP